MTARMSSWLVPAVAIAIGVLTAIALLGRAAGPAQVAISVAIVVGYGLGVHALRTRSDIAGVLSGLPPDERWATINLRALSLSAQVLAVALVVAFLAATLSGGDGIAYAWTGGLFGAAYLGGLAWYRRTS
jgi:hypothetical protein